MIAQSTRLANIRLKEGSGKKPRTLASSNQEKEAPVSSRSLAPLLLASFDRRPSQDDQLTFRRTIVRVM